MEKTESLWQPYSPTYLRNPYPMYAAMRETDPVHLSQTGEWIITRYDDVKRLLKSGEVRSGNRLEWLARGINYLRGKDQELGEIQTAINSFILFLNPPDHMPIRNLVAKQWDIEQVEGIVDETVKSLLSKIDQTDFDVIDQFAKPLPVKIISSMMGIPERDYHYLSALGTRMIRSFDLYHTYRELVELNEASQAFVTYFRELLHTKSAHPDGSLTSRLIEANRLEKELRDEQMISVFIFLFIAGEETTASSIGTAIYNLISHPESYEHLRANPAISGLAADELFRYDPPVQFLGRIARNKIEVGGKLLPAEAPLNLVIAAANRDPSQFEKPDELRLNRKPNHHLAFGSGVHYCLGDRLGRLLTERAVAGFVSKFPAARIPVQDLLWNKNITVRGLQSLKVAVR